MKLRHPQCFSTWFRKSPRNETTICFPSLRGSARLAILFFEKTAANLKSILKWCQLSEGIFGRFQEFAQILMGAGGFYVRRARNRARSKGGEGRFFHRCIFLLFFVVSRSKVTPPVFLLRELSIFKTLSRSTLTCRFTFICRFWVFLKVCRLIPSRTTGWRHDDRSIRARTLFFKVVFCAFFV